MKNNFRGESWVKQQSASIKELQEQNKQLRQVRDTLNTTEDADKIQQLNTLIDANTIVIEANQDAYVRQKMNIGNYQSALDGLKQNLLDASAAMEKIAATKDVEPMRTKLKELKQEAQELELVIKGGTATEDMKKRFQEVIAEASVLQDTMDDVQNRIKFMASDTAVFDAIAQGVNGAFQIWKGTMSVLGVESEEFKEVLKATRGASDKQRASTEEDFLLWVSVVSKFMGYRINPKKARLAEFLRMDNLMRINARKTTQQPRQ